MLKLLSRGVELSRVSEDVYVVESEKEKLGNTIDDFNKNLEFSG